MRSAEIRARFLRHFTERGHTEVPSASLVADDPTLLLVPAGMVPFKPYFLGDLPAPWKRATSVQKCVRTVDIEMVGRTARHASFFQMCGNFSFGDYFKETAIPLAWDLLTRSVTDGGFGFAEDRLWTTVFDGDEEAEHVWTEVVGVPADRVQRRGAQDNYWSMGVPGPCGPCSEIYFDRGPAYGSEGGPVADEERYLEVWNLVFMQYERGSGAGYDFPILRELPARNIDTGLGLERMATILQEVDNLYEIDISRMVLDRAGELTGHRYGADPDSDVSLRVIADHARTATMLIGDGIIPGNEGRGYVLRRMLRRAVRNLRLLGAHQPVLGELVAASVAAMGPSYPELAEAEERIAAVAVAEEGAFAETLRTGTTLFDTAVGQLRAAGATTLPGERAFTLHDTFGFPIDLTLEMAAEQGLTVDQEGFRALMTEQRARAQTDARARKTGHTDVSAYRALLAAAGPSDFVGYTSVSTEGVLRGLLRDGEVVSGAVQGQQVEVALDRTPFYAEAGGQLADTGSLVVAGGTLEVLDVQRVLPDLVVHRARVVAGEVTLGGAVAAEVDVARRRAISRAHTATHLVHRAVRALLGEAATQAGSQNAPGRLRFDFAAPQAVQASVLLDVEDEVNAVLADDLPVRAFVTSQQRAREIGAMALFGEKYGEQVRIVEVGDYARELCGGTHAQRSGQLGMVKILGESSIGTGVRRVEALVGLDAFRFSAREHVLVSALAESFKVPAEQLPDRVAAVLARLREAERDLQRLRAAAVLSSAAGLAAGAADVSGVAVVAHAAPAGTAPADLRRLASDVAGRLGAGRPGVVAVASSEDPVDPAAGRAADDAAGRTAAGKVAVVVAVNEAGRARRLAAGELVRELAPILGGRGGGKDDLAQGGGDRPAAVAEALAQLGELVSRRLSGSW